MLMTHPIDLCGEPWEGLACRDAGGRRAMVMEVLCSAMKLDLPDVTISRNLRHNGFSKVYVKTNGAYPEHDCGTLMQRRWTTTSI